MSIHRGHGKQDSRPLISKIKIEKLFYTYSYVLDLTRTPSPESGRLMLLYGNNGSGKTTILNLLYHLLEPEPYGGHRSYVGGIPFKLFQVHLVGGVVVTASRSKNYDAGPYDLRIDLPRRKTPLTWRWTPELRGRPQKIHETKDEKRYRKFCSALEDLGLSFHYLRDSRSVEGDLSSRQPIRERHFVSGDEAFHIREEVRSKRESLSSDILLDDSVEAAILWFQQRALSASNVGYTSVNAIYGDIIKGIVTAGRKRQKTQLTDPGEIIHELIALKEKNSEFARFGLTPELRVQNIVSNIESAKPSHLTMLNTVLRPYLDGHAARLDALEELRKVMNSFVSLLGEFYSHKRVSIHLEMGLDITADIGQKLNPGDLSSGEKQLLLLFCNAISSRRDKTILMIDEPEISLNVKWQRELIRALLTCMSGTAFQLILATHSVELISQYRDHVSALDGI